MTIQQLLYYCGMQKRTAVTLLETLSSGIRLDIYRLLVRAGGDGMVAGAISSALGLPPTNISFHLKAMAQSGLVTVEQEGRYLRYRADLDLMAGLVAYLTEECCAGRPELCIPAAARRAPRRKATP